MLALLSSPVRRFVLMALLIPAVAFVLVKVAGFLERRNDGRTTKTSRVLCPPRGSCAASAVGASRTSRRTPRYLPDSGWAHVRVNPLLRIRKSAR